MTLPLYPSEAQIAREVLGPNRLDEWRGLAIIWERQGLPQIDAQAGGRFWPAVELWFRARHRVATIAPGQLGKPSGVETCPQPKKRQGSSGENVATVHQLRGGLPDATS